MKYNVSDLRPGDCLLYNGKSLYSTIIAIKTWHPVSHVEIYIGAGFSVASRDGIGVGQFEYRESPAKVMRPAMPFDLARALRWFRGVAGQKYDWLGLLRFTWGRRYIPGSLCENRMFCSEFATRFFREGGMNVFNDEDADAIAPFQFAYDGHFKLILPESQVSEAIVNPIPEN